MRTAISSSSFVGRETDYALRPFAWGPARGATVKVFAGPAFVQRFTEVADILRALGVEGIEVWSAHISPAAAPETVRHARAILDERSLAVVAYAASLRRPGLDASELRRTFEIARDLGAPLIAGGLHPAYAEPVHDLCREFRLPYAIENHPELDGLEIRAQLDGREDWFRTTLDTGWYVTTGADLDRAIETLREDIAHVHLKDVVAAGLPHRTCALGDGIVDIPAVLRRLRAIGYDGAVSIEHEPPHYDPTDDLRRSLERLRAWLGAGG